MISYTTKIIKSLIKLTKKNTNWQWIREYEKTFQQIRQLIIKE